MNLFSHRASGASPLPAEDGLDSRLQATLQQAYVAEDVSPALRQRIADMAVTCDQQTVMRKPVRWPRRLVFAFGSAAVLLCFTCWFSSYIRFYTIPSEAMEPNLMGHDAGQPVAGDARIVHADTIHDTVVVNKGAYRWNTPQCGDVVVFLAPREADAEHRYNGRQVENVLAKRLIGLPGDTIEIKEGHVYRNGSQLNEFRNPHWPYSIREPMDQNLEEQFTFATRWRGGPVRLKADEYWVMGDNRNDSNDSRYWGVLERKRIIGKITFIVAPLSRWRRLP